MPEGFTNISIDDKMMQELEQIKDLEGCKSKTETLRQILRVYREARGLGSFRGGHPSAAPTGSAAAIADNMGPAGFEPTRNTAPLWKNIPMAFLCSQEANSERTCGVTV